METETLNCYLAVFAGVSAIATAIIAWFTFQTIKLAKSNLAIADRLAWLTGALESHSQIQLRLSAKEHDVEAIWWDPTIAPAPSVPKHGEKADLSKIYLFLPESLRAGKEKLKYRIG